MSLKQDSINVRNANILGESIASSKMDDINQYIKNKRLKVIVKPNSNENKILGYDNSKNALKVAISSAPEKGKANHELTKFLSKLIGKKIVISSGLKSREKILLINPD
jgi:uncharacterized protein (TIGR00251 family)